MASDEQFKALLTTQVDLILLERGSDGDVGNMSSFSLPAHVEFKRQSVLDREGRKVVSTAIVFLDSDAPEALKANGEWQVWFSGRTLQVVAVDEVLDPRDGTLHHYEVTTV